MESLESLIRTLPGAPVPQDLKARILASVVRARETSYRLHRNIFGAFAALGALLFVPALFFGVKEMSVSAFGSYLSLLGTDSGAALANWKVFLLSLIESAPLVGAVFTLGAAFVFLASLKALAPYLKQHRAYSVS